jgi:hypothetical protein
VAAIIASDNVFAADSTILDGLSTSRKLSRNGLGGDRFRTVLLSLTCLSRGVREADFSLGTTSGLPVIRPERYRDATYG